MKKSTKNLKTPILIATLIVIATGLCIGSFFIGYNKGRNDYIQEMVAESESNAYKLEGIYQRSYYDNYSTSRNSYIVLRSDTTCNYISSVLQEKAPLVDFDALGMYTDCHYEYDSNNKKGTINLTVYGSEKITTIDFSFNGGSIVAGGSIYTKLAQE